MAGNAVRTFGMGAAALALLAFLAGCGSPQPSARRASARAPLAGAAGVSSAAPRMFAPAPVIVLPPAEQIALLSPEPAPAPAAGVAGKTVILDAGHGGHDAGASHFGLNEKDINLDLALRTASILRARGVNVVMTRTTDQFIPLPERSAVANRSPNATLVSIHTNAAPNNPSASGIETFVLSHEQSDQERSRAAAARYRMNGQDTIQGKQALATLAVESRHRGPALASSLQQSLCGGLGEPNRGVKTKNLAVLRETYFGPAALVEVGFLTNPRSAGQMRTDEWRRRAAGALADGIGAFLSRM